VAQVRILETTIRDGGYEISHQFTEEDVALVVSTLDAAGVSYIEVGHGMGVGSHEYVQASARPKERPVAGDHAHMGAAKRAARRAKVGVLLGAGDSFCPPDYLEHVAGAGMDFVRIAFMPSECNAKNMRYVERARSLGLLVSINLMQTYILTPEEVVRAASMCESAGAQWWYVVDSAGGMRTADVRTYIRAVAEGTRMRVGLHAHNNLGLAVANSLAAVEEGATLVDCTLNGLGRATGNAPTEQLLLALQSLGHEDAIDVEPLTRLSQMYRVLFEDKGNSPMNFVSGAAMLHSRNVPEVKEQAARRNLSLADYMVRVGAVARSRGLLDRFQFPAEVFERAAEGCKPLAPTAPAPELVEVIAERTQRRTERGFAGVCDEIALRAARYHLPGVLHLVPAQMFPYDGALPWQSRNVVGMTVPWSGGDPGEHRTPDHIVIDTELVGAAALPAAKRSVLALAWHDLWQDAIRATVSAVARPNRHVWIPVSERGALENLAARLALAGHRSSPERSSSESVVVVASSADITSWRDKLRPGDIVVLVDRGSRARAAVPFLRAAGAQALMPAIGSVIAARIDQMLAVASQLQALTVASVPGLVDPLQAPAPDEAVVDLAFGAIVENGSQPLPRVIDTVAQLRAAALASGRGTP